MNDFLRCPLGPVVLKLAVAVGIGMLIGMERKWSHKEAGIRTFSIIALLGMLSAIIGQELVIGSLIGVFLLVIAINLRNIRMREGLEITTSAALIVNYILGVMVGMGHMFTPVAGAIVMTLLLALKSELNRFAGGLQPAEVRSAIVLGLIGFVIYPLMPDRYIDPWHLFNPNDAWLSVIAISGIGFINYVLLRVFSTNGLYWGAIFGGLVNSSATMAEMAGRAKSSGVEAKIIILCLLTTLAMFVRNLLLVALFAPAALPATLFPLLVMSAISALFIWKNYEDQHTLSNGGAQSAPCLDTPLSFKKVTAFGLLFILIQVGGPVLNRLFGSYGMLATGIFGGLVSSASTTAAAATMASYGQIVPVTAGTVAILSSLASAAVNMPIAWKMISDKQIIKKVTVQLTLVIIAGVVIISLDNAFHLSERLVGLWQHYELVTPKKR